MDLQFMQWGEKRYGERSGNQGFLGLSLFSMGSVPAEGKGIRYP
jgi:hypothetical protein